MTDLNAIHVRLTSQDDTLREQTGILSRIDENTRLTREELIGTKDNPGRVPKLEIRVDELETHQNRAIGFAAAIGAFLTFIETATHWKEFVGLFRK